MANKIILSHEKTPKGNYIQHIMVNGIELSGRTVTKSDDFKMYDDLLVFLNDKAQNELSQNPRFAWTTLYDWRRWANTYVNEFSNTFIEQQKEDIIRSIEEANK